MKLAVELEMQCSAASAELSKAVAEILAAAPEVGCRSDDSSPTQTHISPTPTTVPTPIAPAHARSASSYTPVSRPAKMVGQRGPVPVPQHSDATQVVLDLLHEKPTLHSNKDLSGFSQVDVKAALDRLASRSMVTYQTADSEVAVLTKEAQTIVDEGSHEWKVWDVVKRNGRVSIKDLPVRED